MAMVWFQRRWVFWDFEVVGSGWQQDPGPPPGYQCQKDSEWFGEIASNVGAQTAYCPTPTVAALCWMKHHPPLG